MASNFIFKSAGFPWLAVAIVLPAFFAFQCEFPPDTPVEFVQQAVSPLSLRISIEKEIGAPIHGTPQLALNYLLFYQQPDTQLSVTLYPPTPITAFPALDTITISGIIPSEYLNPGFALGYGNYVLGVAEFIVYDDIAGSGVYAPGDTILGCSQGFILAYLQGAATQDLEQQFGALNQGYNLCETLGELNGVNDFITIAPSDTTVSITLYKDPSEVQFPVVH